MPLFSLLPLGHFSCELSFDQSVSPFADHCGILVCPFYQQYLLGDTGIGKQCNLWPLECLMRVQLKGHIGQTASKQ